MMVCDYTELLCSLPNLDDPFKYQKQSISPVQLQKRMNMLQYEDYRWLKKFRGLFYWRDIPLEIDEEKLVKSSNRFVDEIAYPDLKSWLLWRMDVRTIIAALRRRNNGENAPTKSNWGYGRYVQHIQTHWSSPSFKLESRYTFLPEINQHLVSGESYLLEKALLKAIWNFYSTRTPQHLQGFSAVVLYLMRWDLIDHWNQYNAAAGAERFNKLVASCIPQTLEF